MENQKIKIPDIAYSIEGNIVGIEQSIGCGEFTVIEIHKIHLQLIAEEMGLVKPVLQAHMSEVVEAEISEFFWGLEDHWQALGDDSHVNLDHLVEAKNLYKKLCSICRLIGLDPASLSSLESNKAQAPATSKPSEGKAKQAEQGVLV